MSIRTDKVDELIRQELAEFFNKEIEFPLDTLVTITRVKTQTDLKSAIVWLSVLPFDSYKEILNTLKNERKNIQHFLNRHLHMRFVPQLKYKIDETEEKAEEVERLLDKINENGSI